ncbi:tetratricopeptide repeat protein [Altererythrobacter halimionae]|uniref:Tetratricopeptide repeat protein n=2 Tax=Alteriqipengyuania halimionae TaxID=1926630 RepID=A0A6I4U5Z1_9SPHN|nr:tetratricopeptide repeat protein [Alteriqipengyuania halimionae]
MMGALLASSVLLCGNVAAQDANGADTYETLAARTKERAGDPAFDYQLGIAALDAGRYGEAIIALQRVLAVQPDNAAARAELARAYALAGDIDTARQEFASVVEDPSLPDPVRQRFAGFVRQLDKQIAGGGSDVSGFLDARAGYDSNVNAATDLDTIVIPLFSFLGPGTLGPLSRPPTSMPNSPISPRAATTGPRSSRRPTGHSNWPMPRSRRIAPNRRRSISTVPNGTCDAAQ